MALVDKIQYQIENASLYFQGGVRRGIVILTGICIVALVPIYFAGQLTSSIWRGFWFDDAQIVNPNTITVKDYSISDTQIVELADGTKDLYVSVSNKENKTIGFAPWVYTIQVLNGSGQVLSQQRTRSYLLPDETKFIVARSGDAEARSIRINRESGTVPVFFNELSQRGIRNPDIEIRQQNITETPEGTLRITAQFKNNDIVTIGQVDVLYIIRDTRQSVVGIGTYQFNGFGPNQLRDISLEYPRPANRETKSLDLRYSVNYLDENNLTFR